MNNDSTLFIAAIVNDREVIKKFPLSNNWKNDGIEIWIDGAGDQGTMTDFGGEDPDNFQLVIDAGGKGKIYRNNNDSLLKKIKYSVKRAEKGYIVEMAIPLKSIPEYKAGSDLGFNISFVDADGGGNDWNHILWQGKKENNPEQWGKLKLLM